MSSSYFRIVQTFKRQHMPDINRQVGEISCSEFDIIHKALGQLSDINHNSGVERVHSKISRMKTAAHKPLEESEAERNE